MNQSTPNIRPIRSFVLRESRMTNAQKQAISTLWSKYGLDLPAETYDIPSIFNNDWPNIIEIGFGNGDSLVEMAKTTQANFIGIEVHRPGVGKILQNIEKHQLSNIKIINADVVTVLRQHIADNSLHKVQIFFPDPWQKKRHHKRRLVQAEFVHLILSKLIPGGEIHLATDWHDYAMHMQHVMADFNQQQLTTTLDASNSAKRPNTRFELRGIKLGHTIYDYRFIKK